MLLSRVVERGSEYGDKAQFGVFFDYADLRQVTPIPDLQNRVQLASAGVLARYTAARFFHVEFDLGKRLRFAPTVPVAASYGQISLTGRL